MGTPPFAKLATFDGIGQVLALLEDSENGNPCVSLRVSVGTEGAIARTEYIFPGEPNPDDAVMSFFENLQDSDLEAMGNALVEQAKGLL